ncbi:hypothetical protein LOTGIDRAFT_153853 [Lottia gigantea]|uniref:Uncharacterized protein n=1 Tax=Lottia gigantea TaxID=225164 RepID=V4BRC9_LOTGI|nr:hypothetical protein LOTGIDRAFT_153853 [Lottia gigantea]ESO91414.1 hypothetical protein LOTGIDRAFT_153853 [Lottia gigantea]
MDIASSSPPTNMLPERITATPKRKRTPVTKYVITRILPTRNKGPNTSTVPLISSPNRFSLPPSSPPNTSPRSNPETPQSKTNTTSHRRLSLNSPPPCKPRRHENQKDKTKWSLPNIVNQLS